MAYHSAAVEPPCYRAPPPPQVSYLNIHQALSNQRQQAKESGGQGPRCIVVGPTDAGKSSLCKMLANWAVRMGTGPTFVDLDIGALKQ